MKLESLKNKALSLHPSFWAIGGLVLLLILSWLVLQKRAEKLDEDFHALLQEKVQSVISNYVEENNPEVKSIRFHKVWTKETSDPGKMKIFFSYALEIEEKESGGDLLVDAEAVLRNSEENKDRWILEDFQVKDSFFKIFRAYGY